MLQNSSSTNHARYPLLHLAVCFCVGVVLANKVEITPLFSICIIGIFSLSSLAVRRAAVLALSIVFVALGALCFQLNSTDVRPDRLKRIYDERRIDSGTPVTLAGKIVNGPEPTADGSVLTLTATSIGNAAGMEQTASGNVRVYLLGDSDERQKALKFLDIGYGTTLRFECPLRREENFQNPGVFSQIQLLDQQGIDAICTVKDPASLEVTARPGISPLRWLFDMRRDTIRAFSRLLDPPTAAVMTASLLGDAYFLDHKTADVFREGGTFHVLVISGLHITFIGGLTLVVVGLFTKDRYWRFLIAAGSMWGYTLAVGAEIPVVRASLMFTILLLSNIVRRNGTLLNSLGLCALILLVWRPQDLFTASFQLTFASVGAIVGIAFPLIEKMRSIGNWRPSSASPFPPNVPRGIQRICETLYWEREAWLAESRQNTWSANVFKIPFLPRFNSGDFRWVAAYLFEGLLVSAIVQISLLPFSIYYFHRVSYASILLNLWVGIILAVETVFAVAAAAIATVSDALASPFAAAAELANRLLIGIPSILMEAVPLSTRVPVYPGIGKILYPLLAVCTALIAILVFKWRPFSLKPRKMSFTLIALSFITVLLASVIVLHPFSSPKPDGRLTVEFLDVGQGDSAFVAFPNGQTMLIDGGGRFSYGDGNFIRDLPRIGERVVSEFLWERGYSKIDYVIATHADADHMQGLADVVRNFAVGEVIFARSEPNDPEFAELQSRVRQSRVRTAFVGKGDALSIGGAHVEVLHPFRDDSENSISDNNASLVIRIKYGSRYFLFAGDIELAGENTLLDDRALLKADVIKVPHHGSKTSSTQHFVDAVDPKVAVISVGRRSTFGHPSEDVVARWKASGAAVLTTGENGTITISTDGSELLVSSYLNRNER